MGKHYWSLPEGIKVPVEQTNDLKDAINRYTFFSIQSPTKTECQPYLSFYRDGKVVEEHWSGYIEDGTKYYHYPPETEYFEQDTKHMVFKFSVSKIDNGPNVEIMLVLPRGQPCVYFLETFMRLKYTNDF